MAEMLGVRITGDDALILRLTEMSEKVHARLLARVTALSIKLRSLVQSKLQGPVLNKQSGALLRSIQREVVDTGTGAIGRVFSTGDVKYAAIHEFGGTTKPHDILPRKAQALAFQMGAKTVFAKVVHHPGSHMPERSYMRSSLDDMAAEIKVELTAAVAGAAAEA